jgi:hypothetical protein
MPSPQITWDAQPLQQATTTNVPAGVSFDSSPLTQPTTVSVPATASASQPQPSQPSTVPGQPAQASDDLFGKSWGTGTISANPQPTTLAGKVERWAQNVSDDLKYGTDLTGIGTVLKKMGAHGVYSGQPEAVGDFVASLPLGLLKSTAGLAEVAQPGKRVQGAKNTVGGVLQAATIPGSFAGPEAAELTGAGVDAGAAQAGKAAQAVGKAIAKPFDVQGVQQPLQQGIRDLLGSVEKSAGVTPTSATSIRDVAANLSEALRAKSAGIYQQLDAATGGRFQRFDEALDNIRQALRDGAGLDDDKELHLMYQQDGVEAARQAALDKAAAAGVDPKLIQTANQTWRQQAALSDLSNSIRQSTSGLRPEIANGAKATPETVNAKTLFGKVNRLYDKATPNGGNRLADAIGQENAQNLLRHVDSMYLEAQKIAARNKYAGMAAKAIGLGGAGSLGYEAMHGLHSLLGN